MEWITENKNPIRHIQTVEVKLSEKEVLDVAETAIINAFKENSNPCITKIISEVKRALKQAYSKPKIQ